MSFLAKETNGKSYNTAKYSYDTLGIPSFDYDNDEKIMKWQETAETTKHKKPVDLREKAKSTQGYRPLLTYFLDGSRHVYKVDDISYNRQLYPIIAGQIGVGCCKRVDGLMHPEKSERQFVIVMPDVCNAGGWDDEAYFTALTEKLNNSRMIKKLPSSFNFKISKILYYKKQNGTQKTKIDDLGIAKVQDYMVELEKEMVMNLVREGKLNEENYLVKDGSLEYKPTKTGNPSLRELQKIKGNYRWVIGVSKRFNPESINDHTGKPNANYIAELPLFHRTPVALYQNPTYLGDVKFGVWYIRLRDSKFTRTPFDGVIKVEKIILEDKLDSSEVDDISADLINERTPTCYGKDLRWANHIYPVFLTESYIKSQYISADTFLQLF